jgi:hypothetical protein
MTQPWVARSQPRSACIRTSASGNAMRWPYAKDSQLAYTNVDTGEYITLHHALRVCFMEPGIPKRSMVIVDNGRE